MSSTPTQLPLVSIVIPALNAGSVLAQTLESVRAQTFKDFEAVIVDNGSTDATASVAQAVIDSDARFRMITCARPGLGAARNAGIAATRGELVAFLDADDLWYPEKLARQVALFREDPRMNFAYTNMYFWDGERDLRLRYQEGDPLPEGDPLRRLLEGNLFGTSTVMVRRAALESVGCFDPELERSQDYDLWLRLAEQGVWARGTREPLVRYRRWSGNISRQRLKMRETFLRLLNKNIQTTRHPELLPLYRRAIQMARAKLELAQARQSLDTNPRGVPGSIWRAWRACPGNVNWLLWFVAAAWPKVLGGQATQGIIHRKLVQRF